MMEDLTQRLADTNIAPVPGAPLVDEGNRLVGGDQALASLRRDDLSAWLTELRATQDLPKVGFPLRVIDCQETVRTSQIVLVRLPAGESYAIVSHRWNGIRPWTFGRRPWPASGDRIVRGASKEAIVNLARFCLNGLDSHSDRLQLQKESRYLWIDCVCIDQDSALEKQHEVQNMGLYYTQAARCIICPYGIDRMGPPLANDGTLPDWHERAWTLQERVLTWVKAEFLYCLPPSPAFEEHPEWKTLFYCDDWPGAMAHVAPTAQPPAVPRHSRANAVATQDGLDFDKFRQGPCNGQLAQRDPERTRFRLYSIPNTAHVTAIQLWRDRPGTDDVTRRQAGISISRSSLPRNWNIVGLLREMQVRQATIEEDLIFGCIGMLGISLPTVRYGQGLRAALLALVEGVHVDQRVLLTVVEAWHCSWIDGYTALPRLNVDRNDRSMCRAPPFHICRALGQAIFDGHRGLIVTSPVARGTVRLQTLRAGSRVSTQRAVPDMTVYGITQNLTGAPDLAANTIFGVANIEPDSLKLADEVTLVAVAQAKVGECVPINGADLCKNQFDRDISPLRHDDGIHNAAVPTEIPSFLCLVCASAGSVHRKIGLLLVLAPGLSWRLQRLIIA